MTIFAYLNFEEDAEKIHLSALGLSLNACMSLFSIFVPNTRCGGAFPDPKCSVWWDVFLLPACADPDSPSPLLHWRGLNIAVSFSCCSVTDGTRMALFRGKL